MNPFKSWPQRLLELALAVLVAALMLDWAWALLRPLLPILGGIAAILVIGRLVVGYYLNRRRYW